MRRTVSFRSPLLLPVIFSFSGAEVRPGIFAWLPDFIDFSHNSWRFFAEKAWRIRVRPPNNRVGRKSITGETLANRWARTVPLPKDRHQASSQYRQPPAEHQFKKGVSGNPKGRPKKKAVQPGGNALGSGAVDRLSAMALAEANRPIPVREGDEASEIPAIQAVLRTMFRAAAQGDTRAARQLLDVVGRAESGRAMAAQENYVRARKYIEEFRPIFEKHEREGRDPPHIYPHPDDLLIDEHTGDVTIDGPISKEQAGARKALREMALQAMPRYHKLKRALVKDPKNREQRKEFKELQTYFDFLQKDRERDVRHRALRGSRRIAGLKSDQEDE
jgi:hypothetical protein